MSNRLKDNFDRKRQVKGHLVSVVLAIFIFLASLTIYGFSNLDNDSDDKNLIRSDLNVEDRQRVRKITLQTRNFSKPERFEKMSGGKTTSVRIPDPNAFSHPSSNLTPKGREQFFLGNAAFKKIWVAAPASTSSSDGLGPFFNARSCQRCHIKDGRGNMPAMGERPENVVLRLNHGSNSEENKALRAPGPDPAYGLQIQNFATPGLMAEADIDVSYKYKTVRYPDGTDVELRRPVFNLTDLQYGELSTQTSRSIRMAPPVIGLGLIEAISEVDILSQADPDDHDGDGISGKPNWVGNAESGKRVLGRFGWKAGTPSISKQTSEALVNDMGLSSPLNLAHWGDCTEKQVRCLTAVHGVSGDNKTEIKPELVELMEFYVANLAVPARRMQDDKTVLSGKSLFYEARCASCHTPKYVTRRDAVLPEHQFQLIWPYSDFLLHDMGEGLSDGFSEWSASGREWRTPPLWGIGLTKTVNPNATYLHDGRARTLEEAILWHDGEASPARQSFMNLSAEDRENIIAFLRSL